MACFEILTGQHMVWYNVWYDQHKCGSEKKSKIFCWSCSLLTKNKTIWSAEGFGDLQNKF